MGYTTSDTNKNNKTKITNIKTNCWTARNSSLLAFCRNSAKEVRRKHCDYIDSLLELKISRKRSSPSGSVLKLQKNSNRLGKKWRRLSFQTKVIKKFIKYRICKFIVFKKSLRFWRIFFSINLDYGETLGFLKQPSSVRTCYNLCFTTLAKFFIHANKVSWYCQILQFEFQKKKSLIR